MMQVPTLSPSCPFLSPKPEYNFLDLSELSFELVFHSLCAKPFTAGSHSPYAHALATTCKQLNSYFCERYVIALSFSESVPAAQIARALTRYPLVEALSIAKIDGDVSFQFSSRSLTVPRLDVLVAFPAHPFPTVTSLTLTNIGLVTDKLHQAAGTERPLQGIAGAFPNLTSLSLHRTDPLIARDLHDSIFYPLSQSLERLDVSGLDFCRYNRQGLSDEFGLVLLVVKHLTHLNISRCPGLKSRTFLALAKMPKLRTLEMRGTRVSDEDFRGMHDGMDSLEVLDVTGCECLSNECVRYLPETVHTLTLSSTYVLGEDVDTEFVPSPLKNLQFLDARLLLNSSLNWHYLKRMSLIQELRVSGETEKLLSVEAASAISEMHDLRILEVSDTYCGDEVATVIARCSKIRKLWMCSCRMLTDVGAAEIANGVCRHSLVLVDFRLCSFARFRETKFMLVNALRSDAELKI